MFNKLLGYFKYRKTIEENLNVLQTRYKLKYDRIYGRLYTVLNIPINQQDVLKTYGNEYLDNEVKKYISSIESYFYSINLFEMIAVSKIDRLDEVNVLIVLKYRFTEYQKLLYSIGIVGSISIVGGILALLINFVL